VQRTCGVCLGPQPLDGRRDRSLISREGLTNRSIVVDVLGHHAQYVRKIDQRNECRIKSLLLGRVCEGRTCQPLILLQPVIHVEDFLRIGRSGCDLREQRIRVNRNWR
jgi:hypothetical protein